MMKFLTVLMVSILAVVGGSSYAVKPQPSSSFGDPLRVKISETLINITRAIQGSRSSDASSRVEAIVGGLGKLLLLSEQFHDLFVAHRDYANHLYEEQEEGEEQLVISQLKRSAERYNEWAVEVFEKLVAIEAGLEQQHHAALRGVLHEVNLNAQHLVFNPYMVEPLREEHQQFFIEQHVEAYDRGELTASVDTAVKELAETAAAWTSAFWINNDMDKLLEQVSTFIAAAKHLRKFNRIKSGRELLRTFGRAKAERESQVEHDAQYQQYVQKILAELQSVEATLAKIDNIHLTNRLLKEIFNEARNAIIGDRREHPLRSFQQLLTDFQDSSDAFLMVKNSASEHLSGSSGD